VHLEEPARTSIVELNRTTLRLWEWGDVDAPPVLCVHGAQDHGRMWDEIAPQIAGRGYRVVALDCRGHGDSGRLSSGHLWLNLALDLCLLAREVGPPVGIIGHSMGAGQAMFVAGVWPELVRWVVNIDGLGPPEGGFRPGDIVEQAKAGLAGFERATSGPPRVYASQADMVERRLRVNHRMPRCWMEHLVEHGSRRVEGGWTWKADPLFNVGMPGDFDVAHLAAEIAMVRAPVLVLTGHEDDTWSDLTPTEKDARLAHVADLRRHVVVEGAGHYVHLEQPAIVVDAIDAFLDEVGP
jgi:pimeloyl-ACP methyl ester carboxylesterase